MDPASASIRRARPLLGTFVEIGVSGMPCFDRDLAFAAAFDAVAKVHRLMSFHEHDSDLSRLNRAAAQHPVDVDPWTFEVLQASYALHLRSDRAFDVTVAPELQDIGLLPRPQVRQPARAEVIPMADSVELLPGDRIHFRHPDVRIDLGGIAKGFAVDRAIEALKTVGAPSGFVNAGGDFAAFGPCSEPVHIRDPRAPQRLLCRVEVSNEALASTGLGFDPLRSATAAGSAIIDPRTRCRAEGIAGATVRTNCCMIADALTKIVMIDADATSALLEHYAASALLVRSDGEVLASPNWKGTASLAA